MIKNKEAAASLLISIVLWTMPPYILYRKGWQETKPIVGLLSILAAISSVQAYNLKDKEKEKDRGYHLEPTPDFQPLETVSSQDNAKEAETTKEAEKTTKETKKATSKEATKETKRHKPGLFGRGEVESNIKPNKTITISKVSSVPVSPHLDIRDDYQREGYKLVKDMAWFKALMLAKPILLVGGMGAGKTTFTTAILYARMLFFSHRIYICDPHTTSWPKGAKVYGQPKPGESEPNWDEINQGLAEYYAFTLTSSDPITCVFDEVTIYEGNVDKKLMGNLLTHSLSFVRKFNMWPILISHNDTIATLGGGKGGYAKMMAGMVTVTLYPERDEFGILKPSGTGTVKNLLSDGKGRYVDTDFAMPPELNQLKSLALAREKSMLSRV